MSQSPNLNKEIARDDALILSSMSSCMKQANTPPTPNNNINDMHVNAPSPVTKAFPDDIKEIFFLI